MISRVLHTEWSDNWGGQEIRTTKEMLGIRERLAVFLASTEHARITQEARSHEIPVFVLPFKGTNEEVYNPSLFNREAMRHQFNIANHEIAIGTLGILRRFKRHDLFVEMARQLCLRHEHLKFFIAGNDPRYEEIQRQIQEAQLDSKVIMTGFLKNPAELLAALDIFTLTSDGFEASPQVVTQAMMMSLLIVLSDSGGVRVFYKNNNLLLVEAGKAEPLVTAVDSLISNPQKREQLAHNRDFAIQHFSETQMIEKVLHVYRQLANKK